MGREMQQKLRLTAAKDRDHTFGDLYSLLCRDDWLAMAWEKVQSNKGSRTAGVDRTTRSNVERDAPGCLARLTEQLRQATCKPSPVRRQYIQELKASGQVKIHPLGSPTLGDRIVHEAVRMILEPSF